MIKVFLADDHAILRDGLRRILNDTKDLLVVGEAADGDEVLRRAATESWDLLVLDLSLAGKGGHEVLREVRVLQPGLRVLVLSMHAAGAWVQQVFDEGAAGYLSKGEPAERLLEALRTVAAGGWYANAAADGRVTRTQLHAHDALTARQLEILVLVGRGLSPSEIGNRLDLRSSTVSTHLQRIKTTLGLSTNTELARYAARAGLVRD
jgi:two-component system, NarL family, invasion response regulator UvrY